MGEREALLERFRAEIIIKLPFKDYLFLRRYCQYIGADITDWLTDVVQSAIEEERQKLKNTVELRPEEA